MSDLKHYKNMKLLLYTHSDYSDICNIFFQQAKIFFPDIEKILLIDRNILGIPADYKVIFYDDSLSYTARVSSCLNQIDSEIVLFIHEDMILFDYPKRNIIEEFVQLVKTNKADFIKLLKVETINPISELHANLIKCPQELMFSVQPTICHTDKLKNIFNIGDYNIWNFEKNVSSSCLKYNYLNCYMATFPEDKKRGIYHYDSSIFPYIATAIEKGKWNYTEYKKELEHLHSIYKIDKNVRGIK